MLKMEERTKNFVEKALDTTISSVLTGVTIGTTMQYSKMEDALGMTILLGTSAIGAGYLALKNASDWCKIIREERDYRN